MGTKYIFYLVLGAFATTVERSITEAHHNHKEHFVQAMIPAMGLKFLRDSTDSANLLAMESVMKKMLDKEY